MCSMRQFVLDSWQAHINLLPTKPKSKRSSFRPKALDSRQEESQLSLTNPMASLLFAGLLAGAVAADIPLAFFGR